MNKYSDFGRRLRKNSKECGSQVVITRNSSLASIHKQHSPVGVVSVLDPAGDFERLNHSARSPKISAIAMVQNNKIKAYSSKLSYFSENHKKLPELSPKNLTNKHFSDLIGKLDEVIAPRLIFTEVVIQEGRAKELSLEADGYECFKIAVRGKKCPLQVKLKVLQGDIRSYVSLIDPKPGMSANTKKITPLIHEVYENTTDFKAEFAYIGIKALEFSAIQLIAQCSKSKPDYHKRPDQVLSLETPELTLTEDIHQKKVSGKNFIKVNMDIKLLNSPLLADELQSRGENWKSKRDLVIARKKENEREKKKKSGRALSERVKRLEEEAKERERIIRQTELRVICKEWLRVLYVVKSMGVIKKEIKVRRAEILSRIRFNQKATLIQTMYRKKIKIVSNPRMVAAKALRFYMQSLSWLFSIDSNSMVVDSISTSAHSSLLFTQFSNFFSKVVLLQNAYKRYVRKKSFRFAKLRMQWNKHIEKSQFAKRNSSMRRRSNNIVSIPNNIREKVLKEYYYEKWKEFKEAVRVYCKIMKGNKIVGMAFLKCPLFIYTPSDAVMEGLIKKALIKAR